jgi:Domain of unknown function (DUF4262)
MNSGPDGKKAFETARTRKFREGPLPAEDERTIANIEEYGCSVINVARTSYGLGWSYTIGIYDTCGKPEVVTVGLPPNTAHHALNEAARLLRSGAELTKGRYRDLVGEVECEFRPVDPKWAAHLMGWAGWYYGGYDFPVLQVVYPDRENRFPEDQNFDKVFAQPLMQPNTVMTRVEKDFWASTDPNSSVFDWKFPDAPDTRVFLSEAVQKGTEQVTYVSHDVEHGAWQFLGGSMIAGGGPVISCFHHLVDDDRTLSELADLPVGWYATRSKVGEPWVRRKHEEDGNAD